MTTTGWNASSVSRNCWGKITFPAKREKKINQIDQRIKEYHKSAFNCIYTINRYIKRTRPKPKTDHYISH